MAQMSPEDRDAFQKIQAKNAQYGVGGALALPSIAGEVAFGVGLLVADLSGSEFGPSGAEERNQARLEGVVQLYGQYQKDVESGGKEVALGKLLISFLPSWSETEERYWDHENRGEYVKAGLQWGRLADEWALILYGGTETSLRIGRFFKRPVGPAPRKVGNRPGLYEFEVDGTPYVGKADDLNVRPNVSGREKGLTPAERANIRKTDYPGRTHTELEVLEDKRIQVLTGGVPARKSPKVLNKKDPIGPERRHLRDE
jgi:hypothetical protein